MKAEELVKDYLSYLTIEKNRSPLTHKNYERCLERFLSMGKIVNLDDITEEAIRKFRLALAEHHPPIQIKTQAYHVIVLRNFLKYLIKRGHRTVAPETIELPKIPERDIVVLKYEDLERLLAAPKGGDLRSLRDKALLEMLFSTGLRVSELCALDRYSDFDRGELSVRGKGNKIRVVFISERAKKALKAYLEKRVDAEEALFVSLTKCEHPKIIGRIIPRAAQRLIAHYARMTGIPDHVTPHQLRHQFATDLLMNGADIRSVQELLGHANISTTQIYTHVTNKQLREVYKAFHGTRRGDNEA